MGTGVSTCRRSGKEKILAMLASRVALLCVYFPFTVGLHQYQPSWASLDSRYRRQHRSANSVFNRYNMPMCLAGLSRAGMTRQRLEYLFTGGCSLCRATEVGEVPGNGSGRTGLDASSPGLSNSCKETFLQTSLTLTLLPHSRPSYLIHTNGWTYSKKQEQSGSHRVAVLLYIAMSI